MLTVTQKFNVDTLIVEDTYVSLKIGDIMEVIADFIPNADPKTPAPIGWSLGQVPAGGEGTECMEVIGQDIFKGTMTFKAVGGGHAWVTYRMENPVRSKETHVIVS